MTSCLHNVTLKAAKGDARVVDVHNLLLNTVLSSFTRLIPNHPASLRPFANRIRAMLGPLLAPTPSNLLGQAAMPARISVPQDTTGLMQKLHAMLPHCAAKDGSGEEWGKYVGIILVDISRTATAVFRGVIEAQTRKTQNNAEDASMDEVEDAMENELQLLAWRGTYAGCERLVGLLQLLQAYLATKTSSNVIIPIGRILGSTERLLSIYAPHHSRAKSGEMQLNPSVSREERDALYSALPGIHTAAVDCISLLLTRASQTAMSFASEILSQLSWLFQRTRTTPQSRAAIFRTTTQLVKLIGISMDKNGLSKLNPIIRTACHDILPTSDDRQHSAPLDGSRMTKPSPVGQTIPSNAWNEPSKELQDAASKLIVSSMALLPADKVKPSLRDEMDRVAVLLQDEQVLLASVLNPPRAGKNKQYSSLLPFLQRLHPTSMATEALVRPRMPLVRMGGVFDEDETSESEDGSTSVLDRENAELAQNPSVEAPTATTGPVHMPIVAGAASTNIEVGGTEDGELEGLDASLRSPKRLRTPEPGDSEALLGTATVVEPIPKRRRLEEEMAPSFPAPSTKIGEGDGLSNPIIGVTDSPPPVAESSKSAEKALDSDADSEGSFEIPPIVFDSEMSEDEDDEDEDEDMRFV